MSFSVVVPIHNEAEHLQEFVTNFLQGIADMREQLHEILLVENGSTDDTFGVAQRLCADHPDVIRPLQLSEPSYGAAIRRGIEDSQGDWVCILECDVMSTEFVRASAELLNADGADFIVASKRHPQSVDKRPIKRRILTRLFNSYLKLRLGFPGTDTHGLKAIRSQVARHIIGECITAGEVLQTEMVLLAYRLGYRVVEVPLRLEERRCPPVSIAKRFPKVMKMVGELRASLSRFPAGAGKPYGRSR